MLSQIRLLRLPEHQRKEYLERELNGMQQSELRHICSQYGIQDVRDMSKERMVRIVTEGLMDWASAAELMS